MSSFLAHSVGMQMVVMIHDCTSCIICHIIAHRHNIGVRLLVSFMYYLSVTVSSRYYICVFFFAVRF